MQRSGQTPPSPMHRHPLIVFNWPVIGTLTSTLLGDEQDESDVTIYYMKYLADPYGDSQVLISSLSDCDLHNLLVPLLLFFLTLEKLLRVFHLMP